MQRTELCTSLSVCDKKYSEETEERSRKVREGVSIFLSREGGMCPSVPQPALYTAYCWYRTKKVKI